MGLFDKLFGKKSVAEPKKEIRDILIYSEALSNGEEILVSGLSRQGAITHRDNSKTELILGRIIKHHEDDTIRNENQDYIAFELPMGQKITKNILHSVMSQYDMDKSLGKLNGKACYVGALEETSAGVTFGKRSAAVEKIVSQKVASLEGYRQEADQQYYERRQAEKLHAEEMQVQRIDNMLARDKAVMDKDRVARLSNPTLRQVGRLQSGSKVYMDYDGVDMQTGDILRLRNVDRVCKDQTGQYLYTAYVNTVEHDHDALRFNEDGEPEGKLVAFTLPGRLIDLVNSGRQDQIRTILNLLSRAKMAKDGKMTYIGEINASGEISSGNRPASTVLANEITRMQQQYEVRKVQNSRKTGDEGR